LILVVQFETPYKEETLGLLYILKEIRSSQISLYISFTYSTS